MRYLILMVTSVLLGGCAAGGTAAVQRQAQADGITLRVAPESFELGGSARVSITTHGVGDGVEAVLRVDDAAKLKTLYVELDYDGATLQSVDVQGSGLLGDDALELKVLDQPGKVSYGLALPRPDERDGFNGSGEVARVRFSGAGLRNIVSAAEPEPQLFHGVAAVNPNPLFIPDNEYNNRLNISYDAEVDELNWFYSVKGDYDQNGEIGFGDLTRLARYLGLEGDELVPGSLADLADGDRNGAVTFADLTPIAKRFGQQIEGFRLFSSPRFLSNYPIFPETQMQNRSDLLNEIALDQAIRDADYERLQFKVDVSQLYGQFFWIEEVLKESESGEVSQIVMATEGTPALTALLSDYELAFDSSSQSVRWWYNVPGDYDQNTGTDLGDLAVIGAFLNQVGPFVAGDRRVLVDVNHDNEIDGQDILGINIFLRTRVTEYRIYSTTDAGQLPEDPYQLLPDEGDLLIAAIPSYMDKYAASEGRNYHEVALHDVLPSGSYVWIRPVGTGRTSVQESIGTRSEIIRVP